MLQQQKAMQMAVSISQHTLMNASLE